MTPTYDGPLAGIPTDEQTVRSLDRAHVFHSWSAQALIDPLPIASASGSRFTDYAGTSYLDFSSQLVNVNIGYQHPKLVKAIADYAQQMTTIQPSFANDARSEAARLIAEVAPGDLDPSSSPTAGPRRPRTRCGWRGCTPAGTRCSRPTAPTTEPRPPRSP